MTLLGTEMPALWHVGKEEGICTYLESFSRPWNPNAASLLMNIEHVRQLFLRGGLVLGKAIMRKIQSSALKH